MIADFLLRLAAFKRNMFQSLRRVLMGAVVVIVSAQGLFRLSFQNTVLTRSQT